MGRLLACLTLALLVSATTLHAQQRPLRTPAEERADRKCYGICVAHCSAGRSECVKNLESCFRQCYEREGVSER